jgi:hypothetical protein
MGALQAGECFATVQSLVNWQNLAWSSYLEFTASLVHPTASPEVSMMDGSHLRWETVLSLCVTILVKLGRSWHGPLI